MTWAYKIKPLIRTLLWGTHDNKYVVDHLNRKIVFFESGQFNFKEKKTTNWSFKNK